MKYILAHLNLHFSLPNALQCHMIVNLQLILNNENNSLKDLLDGIHSTFLFSLRQIKMLNFGKENQITNRMMSQKLMNMAR